MPTQLPSDAQRATEARAHDLWKSGLPVAKVQETLVLEGVDPAVARSLARGLMVGIGRAFQASGRKHMRYGEVIGFSGALYFINTYPIAFGNNALDFPILVLVPILVYRGALSVIRRVEGLEVDFFPKPRAAALPADAFAADVAVPRLPGLPAPSETLVLASKRFEGADPFITHAGREPSEKPPEGVMVPLHYGLVFFPAAGSVAGDILRGVSGSVFNLAKVSMPFLGVLAAAGMNRVFTPKESDLPDWMRRSLQHADHFVIPYVEIVRVTTRPAGGGVMVAVTRERDGGTRQVYRFYGGETASWPGALMQLRLHGDLLAAGQHALKGPRAAELLPDLRRAFENLYGDRAAEHELEMARELEARVNDWLDTVPEEEAAAVVRETLAPVLPHYRRVPNVVANQPWLFEGDTPEEPA